MLNIFLLILVFFLLAYASYYDYKHLLIESEVVGLILLAGVVYAFNYDLIQALSIFVFTVMIWSLPTIFGFGLGDFLLLIGLSLFLTNINSMWLFYTNLIVVWLVWTILMVYIQYKKGNRKPYDIMFKFEYPLIPVIAISFYLWFMFQVFG